MVRKQRNHFLEENESLRKYNSHNWHGVGPAQWGSGRDSSLYGAGNSICCFVLNISDAVSWVHMGGVEIIVLLLLLRADLPSNHIVAQLT